MFFPIYGPCAYLNVGLGPSAEQTNKKKKAIGARKKPHWKTTQSNKTTVVQGEGEVYGLSSPEKSSLSFLERGFYLGGRSYKAGGLYTSQQQTTEELDVNKNTWRASSVCDSTLHFPQTTMFPVFPNFLLLISPEAQLPISLFASQTYNWGFLKI